MAINTVRWVFGDEYLSSAAGRMMCGIRDRMASQDLAKMQKPTSSANSENQSYGSGSHE